MQEHSSFISHKGLKYRWHEGAFLTRREACYALEQLWRMCAGDGEWEGAPQFEIPAVHEDAVRRMHQLKDGQLPCAKVVDIFPRGVNLELDSATLPALCVMTESASIAYDGTGVFPLDLVAATFIGLTRWEEVFSSREPDAHGRFQSRHSLAYRHGYLDRPVLDEWALVVTAWLKLFRPLWTPRVQGFELMLSHDIDSMCRYSTQWRILRSALGELIVRSHNPIRSAREYLRGLRCKRSMEEDPCVQMLMQLVAYDESLGLKGSFNLMTASKSDYDEGYDLNDYRVLFDGIRERGHRIGWHPGYRAAEDAALFADEKAKMDRYLQTADYGGRYHYLRWSAEKSWTVWADHGLKYDSSVGYPDQMGYRCGTSRGFRCFSMKRQCELNLVEEPLVIMDAAVTLDRAAAHARSLKILQRARHVGGAPVVLLHNSTTNGDAVHGIKESIECLVGS